MCVCFRAMPGAPLYSKNIHGTALSSLWNISIKHSSASCEAYYFLYYYSGPVRNFIWGKAFLYQWVYCLIHFKLRRTKKGVNNFFFLPTQSVLFVTSIYFVQSLLILSDFVYDCIHLFYDWELVKKRSYHPTFCSFHFLALHFVLDP